MLRAAATKADASASRLAARPATPRQVCPISGLIINDEESRLQDHYSGRNYK